jgi:hypothetical protein
MRTTKQSCETGEIATTINIKIAADLYPLRFIAVQALPKKDGGWKVENFS